jgi:hypothetical protein
VASAVPVAVAVAVRVAGARPDAESTRRARTRHARARRARTRHARTRHARTRHARTRHARRARSSAPSHPPQAAPSPRIGHASRRTVINRTVLLFFPP